MNRPSSVRVWLGLFFLYIAWGSTYLAIRFLVESVPPVLASGARNFLAGALLFGWAKIRNPGVRLTHRDWLVSGLAGILMLTIGNGGVTIAAAWVPSGYASLFSALVPGWLVLLQLREGVRPTLAVLVGLVLGLAGVALLLGLDHLALAGAEAYFGWGVTVLLLATLGWSGGVMVAKRGGLAYPAAYIAGMQMLVGGTTALLLSAALGEWNHFEVGAVTEKSLVAFLYLLTVGSLAAFTVFGWLSKVAPPTLVATYTYVNPLVAILLGWALAGESLNPQMLLATGIIVGAVALITYGQSRLATAEVEPLGEKP
jgi:drug/metabolite transporter (DMT)-like permease